MKKVIRLTESQLVDIVQKVLLEQKENIVMSVYNRIKNRPIVKTIEKLYNPNVEQFVKNVISKFPSFKKYESHIIQQVQQGMKNPESIIQNNQNEIEKFTTNQVQEQIGGIIVLGLIGLVILIVLSRKVACDDVKDATSKIQGLVGKTINLYNDDTEQILYGKVNVSDIMFMDCSTKGGRSHVLINYDWRIDCLANPSRLDSEITVTSRETVGRTTIKTSSGKFNKSFTNNLQELVGQYCKKPDADFAYRSPNQNQSLV